MPGNSDSCVSYFPSDSDLNTGLVDSSLFDHETRDLGDSHEYLTKFLEYFINVRNCKLQSLYIMLL